MTTTHVPGWIELDGVDNMRDVGGLPTTDGGAVVAGRLIRSDNLQELPPASVRHLVDDLGVTDVVDLRTVVEVAKEGDGPMLAEPGVRIHHHTLYTEDTKETGIPAGERRLPWETDRNMGTAAKVRRPAQGRAEARRVLVEALPRLPRPAPGLGRRRPAGDRRGRRRRGRPLRRRQGPDGDHRRARAPRRRRHARGGDRRLRGLGGAAPADPANDWPGIPPTRRTSRARPWPSRRRAPRPCASSSRRSTARADAETWLRRHGWTDDDTQRLRAKLLTP